MTKTMYRCDGRRCDPKERFCLPQCFLTSDTAHANPLYAPVEVDLETGVVTPEFYYKVALEEEMAKPVEQRMPCKRMLEEVDADAVQAGTQLRLLRLPGDSEAGEPVL